MLVSLRINNIALIDECNLTLGKGLNILSGETGAGKSIIIDALSFVLGCRADKSLIRHGEKAATVEAVFDVDSSEVLCVMEELGLPPENVLIVKRTMTDSRNEVRVNGELFTLAMLKKVTALLVDILGQHEHQSLLKTNYHIELLDKFAADKVINIKSDVNKYYLEYKEIITRINMIGDSAERARKIDILKYQIDEITAAQLVENEEEELFAERERYQNNEKIVSAVSNAYNSLESEYSVNSAICTALNYLNQVSAYDTELESLSERLDSAKIELDDIAESLKSYADNYNYDERRANYVENRVDTIKLLKRKYGSTIGEIMQKLEHMTEEYEMLQNAEEEIELLEQRLQSVSTKLYNSAYKLSKERRAAAKIFEERIVAELKDLAMQGTTFSVSFSIIPDIEELSLKIGANGFDDVEFLISPNKGEPLKPLAKIASGGEMSRFMLSLENIISGLDNIATLVFDEIDTGISGHVAQVVAKKLNNISIAKQVIAVTHLPQLASFADNHYLIKKGVVGEKTITDVAILNEEQRVEEIVRLSGGAGSAINKMHAKELLQNAVNYKNIK